MAKNTEDKIAELEKRREEELADAYAKLKAKRAAWNSKIKAVKKANTLTKAERAKRLILLSEILLDAATKDEKLRAEILGVIESNRKGVSSTRSMAHYDYLIETLTP